MWIIAVAMLAIVLLAAVVVAYVAYPYRGEPIPGVPWLGRALQRLHRALPTRHDPSDFYDTSAPGRR
ncbi:MAG TPA: hypothetical protein PLP61_14990 [Nocardioides sp.]|uniref:hypothetical protein n=1 Tax=Nocardioides sp. TaxID=35761 RepID=UPI002CBC3A4C|nr:hypothetical protein [Nocardioides sp.]HQR28346.1 hypothetical protein [Nocardioides sp.]